MAPVDEKQNVDGRESLPTSLLSEALAAAHARVAQLQQEMARLEKDLGSTREEARLLERILNLRDGGAPAPSGDAVASPTVSTRANGNGNQAVVGHVIGALRESERPLHVQELMRLLSGAGVRLPGAGNQANLIGLLRRDARIARSARGMYALAEWGLPLEPTTRRKRRRRRRLTRDRVGTQ
jgi:hypothetical protein